MQPERLIVQLLERLSVVETILTGKTINSFLNNNLERKAFVQAASRFAELLTFIRDSKGKNKKQFSDLLDLKGNNIFGNFGNKNSNLLLDLIRLRNEFTHTYCYSHHDKNEDLLRGSVELYSEKLEELKRVIEQCQNQGEDEEQAEVCDRDVSRSKAWKGEQEGETQDVIDQEAEQRKIFDEYRQTIAYITHEAKELHDLQQIINVLKETETKETEEEKETQEDKGKEEEEKPNKNKHKAEKEEKQSETISMQSHIRNLALQNACQNIIQFIEDSNQLLDQHDALANIVEELLENETYDVSQLIISLEKDRTELTHDTNREVFQVDDDYIALILRAANFYQEKLIKALEQQPTKPRSPESEEEVDEFGRARRPSSPSSNTKEEREEENQIRSPAIKRRRFSSPPKEKEEESPKSPFSPPRRRKHVHSSDESSSSSSSSPSSQESNESDDNSHSSERENVNLSSPPTFFGSPKQQPSQAPQPRENVLECEEQKIEEQLEDIVSVEEQKDESSTQRTPSTS